MVSDLAPADLVSQRVGRLHRHTRPDRPLAISRPVLYLRGVSDWAAEPPVFVRGSRAVYGDAALLRSSAVFDGRDQVTLPNDIPALVRTAYDPAMSAPSGWGGALGRCGTGRGASERPGKAAGPELSARRPESTRNPERLDRRGRR